MSEHSIDELERQWVSARDRSKAAQEAEREALKRLNEAKLDATGLVGHKVSFIRQSWRKPDEEVFFVVDRLRHGNPAGPNVKKDGSLGQRIVDTWSRQDLTDHGPYEAPK